MEGKVEKSYEFREDKKEPWNTVNRNHHAEAKGEKSLENEKWSYANIKKSGMKRREKLWISRTQMKSVKYSK